LLHSCWCIAFSCWNSNSKFEFNFLSLFKISKTFFPSYPISFLILARQPFQSPAARIAAAALSVAWAVFLSHAAARSSSAHGPAGSASRQPAPPPSPAPQRLTAGPVCHPCRGAVPAWDSAMLTRRRRVRLLHALVALARTSRTGPPGY
jgi:hypothetical protein